MSVEDRPTGEDAGRVAERQTRVAVEEEETLESVRAEWKRTLRRLGVAWWVITLGYIGAIFGDTETKSLVILGSEIVIFGVLVWVAVFFVGVWRDLSKGVATYGVRVPVLLGPEWSNQAGSNRNLDPRGYAFAVLRYWTAFQALTWVAALVANAIYVVGADKFGWTDQTLTSPWFVALIANVFGSSINRRAQTRTLGKNGDMFKK